MGLPDRDYMKSDDWQRDQRERLAAWQWESFAPPRAERKVGQRAAGYAAVAAVAVALAGSVGYMAGADLGPFAPDPMLVWGGQGFTTKSQFEAWLQARGRSYQAWASKHPDAAAKLERLP